MTKQKIKPTDDGAPLYSSKHEGAFGELMREERTIGELLVAKKKKSLLFKLLNLFNC